MVKDTLIEQIVDQKWKVRTKVDGRDVLLSFDFNENKFPKELIDKELCLAVVNPDVEKIEF